MFGKGWQSYETATLMSMPDPMAAFSEMDAPARNGIDVPEWKRHFNH